MNIPFPFGIMHEISNLVFFSAITLLLLRLFEKGIVPGNMEKGGLDKQMALAEHMVHDIIGPNFGSGSDHWANHLLLRAVC
jgi:hypothetical protein